MRRLVIQISPAEHSLEHNKQNDTLPDMTLIGQRMYPLLN